VVFTRSFFVFLFALCVADTAYSQVSVIQNTSPIVYIRVNNPLTGVDRTKGSGFILNSDGYLITARHVVEKFDLSSERILVSLLSVNASPVPADIVQCSGGVSDVCLLKISASDVRAANISTFYELGCGQIRIGSFVRGAGFPFGKPIIQVAGQVTGELGGDITYPSDAALVPGMSGGPVFGPNQKVLGIVRGGAANFSNLTFITPFSSVVDLIGVASSSCDRSLIDTAPARNVEETPSQKRITFTNNKGVELTDLPEEAFKIGRQIHSSSELKDAFAKLPSLELIGSTLLFENGSDPTRDITLYLSKLSLRNASIWMGPRQVQIYVKDFIASNSSILAFPPDFIDAAGGRGAAEIEATGEDGQPGLSAGQLKIFIIESKQVADLTVELKGQNGGQGGQGGRGQVGAPGNPGQSGSDSLLNCKRGPGNGGPGRPGSQGGAGGNGGEGGNGGYLSIYLVGDASIDRKQLSFLSVGGKGGSGGRGGPGGAGGAGGPRGRQTTFCHGGSAGPIGEVGENGSAGIAGNDGAAGEMEIKSISLDELLPGLAFEQ